MKSDAFIVRFWGTRGSYPVPGEHVLRYGGNTTCIELQVGPHTVIIDSGSGIINLGHEMVRRSQTTGSPLVATILLTHMHHDHTQGFPFFAPNFLKTSHINILGPHTFQQSLEDVLQSVVLTPNFSMSLRDMPSLKIIYSLHPTETLLLGQDVYDLRIRNIYHDVIEKSPDIVRVFVHKSYAHPNNGVYVYRVEWCKKSVVFASDTEGYAGTDRRLVNFARNTDLLIHDAQYTTEDYTMKRQGWGHSTPQMACEVARMCEARQLVLFHHDPTYDDEKVARLEQDAKKLFPNTLSAYEGLEIVL